MIDKKITKVWLDGWRKNWYINAVCGNTWNGWETPSVTLEELKKVNLYNEQFVKNYGERWGIPTWEVEVKDGITKVFCDFHDEDYPNEECNVFELNGETYVDISNGLCWINVT